MASWKVSYQKSLDVNTGELPVEEHSVNRHDHRTTNPYDGKNRHDRGRSGREHEGPEGKKQTEQRAYSYKNDVESFEGHGLKKVKILTTGIEQWVEDRITKSKCGESCKAPDHHKA
jgi:hypothetical protein